MSDSNIASFPSYEREWLKLLDDGFIGNAVACISAYRALADDEEKEYYAVKVSTCVLRLINFDVATNETFPMSSRAKNGNRWQMPIDFVPIGTKLKPTADDKTPLEDRKNHIACLHRGDDGACNSAISGISLDDFSRKLQQLRLGAHKWGISKIEAILVTGLNTDHPDLQVNGHAISSTNDFFAWLKKGLWSKEKQVVVAFASNDVWGQNNQWAINLEKEFCNMLAVTWSDAKSNGDRMVKPPQGKCFHNIFVKAKGSLCTRIRNNCKRVFRVAVYCRNEGDDAEDEGTIKSVVESNKSRKSKVPKLVAQEVACIDKDGFTGNLGYCEGHPYLDELLTKLGKVKTEVTPAPKSVALSKDDASTITSPLTVSVSSSKEKAGPSDLEMFLMSQGIQSVDDIKKLLGASATESAASLTVDRTAERPTMVMTPEKASVASPKSSEKASSKTKTLAVKTRAKRGASDMVS